MSNFTLVSADTIAAGRATDAYFDRTVETLEWVEKNPTVTAEVTADQFPTGTFEVLAGLNDVAQLLSGLSVDVDALPEGTLFDGGPVVQIQGSYREFAVYETALLGILAQASGIATNALQARQAAPETPMFSFGTRSVHPALAAVVERSALIGGFDGFSNVAAESHLNRSASGTMPHALVIAFGRGHQEAAWEAFDAALPESVPRTVLCDTYSDEVDETIRAVSHLGDALDGVRIDTTSSRRGDFKQILREVKWELEARGHDDVDVFVSGGLTPPDIRQLQPYADGFGVGSYVSTATPIDFALDIVERDGEPVAKRGKLSGRKMVSRGADGAHLITRADQAPPTDATPLLEPLIRDGEIVREFDVEEARKRASEDVAQVGDTALTE